MKLISIFSAIVCAVVLSSCQTVAKKDDHSGHDHAKGDHKGHDHAGHDHSSHGGADDDDFDALEKALEE